MAYTPVGPFKNKQAPDLNAATFNQLERGVIDAHEALDGLEPGGGGVSEEYVDEAVRTASSVVRASAKQVALNKEQPVGMILGSSSIFGSGTPTAERPLLRFARKLERQLQITHGVPENRAPFTTISGDVEAGYTVGGSALQGGLGKFSRLVSDGSSITFKSPYPSTGIWVGFREGASVGTVTVSINGGTPVPIRVGKIGASKWSGQYKSPRVPRGMNTYEFAVSGGGQVFDFVHFYDDSNESGPILLNGGWGESTLGSLLGQASTVDRLASINPDFIVVVSGSNEQGQGVSRADFEKMVSDFNAAVAENTTSPTWVCWVPNVRPGTPDYDRQNIVGPVRETVEAAPHLRTYLDVLEDFWTDVPTDKGVLGILHTDNVHPSAAGHAAIAVKIGEAMGLRPGRGTVPQTVMQDADLTPGPVELEGEPDDPFTVWTTDTFNEGALAERTTDAGLGGVGQPYDVSLMKESTVAEGNLNISSSSSAVFLSPAADDVEASVVYRGQTGNQGWLRVRVGTKASSPRDCVGVRFTRTGDTSCNVQLDQKVGNTTTILSGASTAVQAGQRVGVRAVGNQVSLLVNEEVVETVETATLSGEHVQILGYNSTVTVDDLVVRTVA